MRIKFRLVIVCIAGMMITSRSCTPICGCVDPPPPMLKTGDVLAAGNIADSGSGRSGIGFYGRIGMMMPFTLVSKTPFGVHGIAVSGNDIYVVGDTLSMMGTVPVYWKNGQLSALAAGGTANSIYVSGTDIYIAGTVRNSNGISTAVYWKNGIMHKLAGDSAKYSWALSVFVSGIDVYVAGTLEDATSLVQKAVYWKNDVPVLLTGTTKASNANTIYVNGSDIYVGGYTMNLGGSVATIWKNGTASFLNTMNSGVNGMTVSGNDINAVGSATSTAYSGKTYWKNGELTPLPGTITGGRVLGGNCIAAFGPDIYIGGTSTSGAAIWKNGVETKNYIPNAQVNAIYIIP